MAMTIKHYHTITHFYFSTFYIIKHNIVLFWLKTSERESERVRKRSIIKEEAARKTRFYEIKSNDLF